MSFWDIIGHWDTAVLQFILRANYQKIHALVQQPIYVTRGIDIFKGVEYNDNIQFKIL